MSLHRPMNENPTVRGHVEDGVVVIGLFVVVVDGDLISDVRRQASELNVSVRVGDPGPGHFGLVLLS